MATQTEPPRIHPGTYWLIGAFLFGGVIVAISYVRDHNQHAIAQYEALQGKGEMVRPPFVSKTEEDLVAWNWGEPSVRLDDLLGKVWVAGYAYTGCSDGCEALLNQLKSVDQTFADDPRFLIVSMSVDRDGDTQENLRAFAERTDLPQERWWYLTSPEVNLEAFMRQWVLLQPSEKSEDGTIRHDLRVILVDAKANVRGYYALADPKIGDRELWRLEQEVRYLLDNETPGADLEPLSS